MAYALIVDGVVDAISDAPLNGFIDVSDEVSIGYTANEDGSFTAPPPPPVTREMVNAERDKRIVRGFKFMGKVYDFDMRSKANISGAAQMAFMAIVSGIQAGNYKWTGGDIDFGWVSQDNSFIPMDAQTVVAFGRVAASHESAHVFHARALKDAEVIPADYMDDKYWPATV